jgi:hypothetical protein
MGISLRASYPSEGRHFPFALMGQSIKTAIRVKGAEVSRGEDGDASHRGFSLCVWDCRALELLAYRTGIAGDQLPLIAVLLPDVHEIEITTTVAPIKAGFLSED